jgi:hypothetical protein
VAGRRLGAVRLVGSAAAGHMADPVADRLGAVAFVEAAPGRRAEVLPAQEALLAEVAAVGVPEPV